MCLAEGVWEDDDDNNAMRRNPGPERLPWTCLAPLKKQLLGPNQRNTKARQNFVSAQVQYKCYGDPKPMQYAQQLLLNSSYASHSQENIYIELHISIGMRACVFSITKCLFYSGRPWVSKNSLPLGPLCEGLDEVILEIPPLWHFLFPWHFAPWPWVLPLDGQHTSVKTTNGLPCVTHIYMYLQKMPI